MITDASLALLTNMGLRVPPTRSVVGDKAREEAVPADWSQSLVYLRGTRDAGRSLRFVGAGDSARAALASDAWRGVREVHCQEMLDLFWSGAALVCGVSEVYYEAVRGLSVTLLRRGEVMARVLSSGGEDLIAREAQARVVEVEECGLRSGTLSPRFDEAVLEAIGSIHPTMTSGHIHHGLFEWGIDSSGRLFFLDYKEGSFSELRRLVQRMVPASRGTPECEEVDVDLPDLDHYHEGLKAGMLSVRRGARLSHLVSRLLDSGCEVRFANEA